jgi:hypothetical protein
MSHTVTLCHALSRDVTGRPGTLATLPLCLSGLPFDVGFLKRRGMTGEPGVFVRELDSKRQQLPRVS